MELDETFRILRLCVIDARGLGRIRTDDCAYAARDRQYTRMVLAIGDFADRVRNRAATMAGVEPLFVIES